MFWPSFVILPYDGKANNGSTTNLRSQFLMKVLWKTSNDKSLLSIDTMLDNTQNVINSQRNLASPTPAFHKLVNKVKSKFTI
jgi:hypothetical protein